MGLFKKKDKYALYRKELMRFSGKSLQYAVERIDGQEKDLGKNGGIIVLDDVIVVMCEAKVVFSCQIKDSPVAARLCGNGV